VSHVLVFVMQLALGACNLPLEIKVGVGVAENNHRSIIELHRFAEKLCSIAALLLIVERKVHHNHMHNDVLFLGHKQRYLAVQCYSSIAIRRIGNELHLDCTTIVQLIARQDLEASTISKYKYMYVCVCVICNADALTGVEPYRQSFFMASITICNQLRSFVSNMILDSLEVQFAYQLLGLVLLHNACHMSSATTTTTIYTQVSHAYGI
jgi:hypothetical protein